MTSRSLTVLAHALIPLLCIAQGKKEDYDRAASLGERVRGKVFRTTVSPTWVKGGGFWYQVAVGPNKSEWVLVSPSGKVQRFDAMDALKKAGGDLITASATVRLTRRPLPGSVGEAATIAFDNQTAGEVEILWVSGNDRTSYGKIAKGEKRELGSFAGHVWEVRKSDGSSLGFATVRGGGVTVTVDGQQAQESGQQQGGQRRGASPDGKWQASVDGDNVVIGTIKTTDGTPGDSYRGTGFFWSPDSKKLVVFRTEAPQERKVTMVASSPRDQLQPKVIVQDYLKPGDKVAKPRPVLIDVEMGTVKPIAEALMPNPWSLPSLGSTGWGSAVTWSADSSKFFFAYNERGHQLLRVISVDAKSAEAKTLFEDRSKTFIHYSGKYWSRYLPQANEIIWMSERDGWNHLYVHDASTGAVKRQLTKGEWVVRGVESYDEAKNELLLTIAGRNKGEDPYHVHYARVNVATGKMTPLTEGDGTHRLTFSPDGETYLDVFSRVDQPTITELRRTSDGKKLAELERGNADTLLATGWKMPERFVAKGRDGVTDIWGVIWRPTNFDPTKKYPVVEQIYAGPQGFFVPKQWSVPTGNAAQIAELGFVVVQIDGMGTDGRSKAFHDVCYKNLKDAGFPDRILGMKALAAKYPYLDLNRVGIYGGSAGGQNAMAALLWHGDFYKAAVADCGCHDNRMDKVWWNEQWMGFPVDKAYEDSSNVVHASKLTGKLLLTVGELDTNVDPASTMQVADALIRANKDFEIIVFPNGNHGAGESPYGRRRRMDFFVRHLLGVEPRG
ncbi:MAG TPA: prolyl oligopeptidase family serine peptidase [Fimbriimonadaceae bacterium]|nr:prolyl oligopeptidase family serine peptidase [Fimbriimonadaceae bacterium]